MDSIELKKTQHYTDNADFICGNLKKYIPAEAQLIEPFVGLGDLLKLFPERQWEMYDIEPILEGSVYRDSLISPPSYKQKWVITNPPYLAKNKAKDKKVFEKYQVDDLYKGALLSFSGCEGGMVIIPTNFFTDERTGGVRKKFLNEYEVLELNVFTCPVFSTTTYSVCSFAFKKQDAPKKQNIKINIFPSKKMGELVLDPAYDYRVGGEVFSDLKQIRPVFERLTVDNQNSKHYITNIKLFAIDGRDERICLKFDEEPFVGKNTDRAFATLVCDFPLTQQQEKELIGLFNKTIEEFRKKYFDMPLTNYRDFNRKRVGFTFVYCLLTKIYLEKNYEN